MPGHRGQNLLVLTLLSPSSPSPAPPLIDGLLIKHSVETGYETHFNTFLCRDNIISRSYIPI